MYLQPHKRCATITGRFCKTTVMCLAMQFTPAIESLPRTLSISGAKDWKMRLICGSIAYLFSTKRFVEAVSPINGNPPFFKITISTLKGIVTLKTPHGINPSDATPSALLRYRTASMSHRTTAPNCGWHFWLSTMPGKRIDSIWWFLNFRFFDFS